MVLDVWRKRNEEVAPEPPLVMPLIIWQSLFSRGFKEKEQLNDLFSPSLKSLKDPYLMLNMEKVCQRLSEALFKKEKILIYSDFDLDGSSGLVLFYEGLKKLGFENLEYYQPRRLQEGYGLHAQIIKEKAQEGIDLIITIDVGITALDSAKVAKECGVDLIITDHHLPYSELPDCFAILNPNQKECQSGLGYLCGAGVAFYLLLGLKKFFLEKNISCHDFDPKDLLDLFAIGTLTDLVPLVHENRVLVKHGLLRLAKTPRLGLKRLMEVLSLTPESGGENSGASLDRKLTGQDVSVLLAPKLNALSRMESGLLPRDIFFEVTEDKVNPLVQEILKAQELRKELQKKACEIAIQIKKELHQENYIWVWSSQFHKGVIGLVATYLCGVFHVPTFVGSQDKLDEISGSARAPNESADDLTQALDFSKESLLRHGGHSKAAGFSLNVDKAKEFDSFLHNYFKEQPKKDLVSINYYDSEASFKNLSSQFMNWIEALEPFGKDFPPFVFYFKNIKISNIREVRGGHLKITLTEDGVNLSAMVFSPSGFYKSLKVSDQVEILAEPKWNYFNNSRTLQLDLKSLRLSET